MTIQSAALAARALPQLSGRTFLTDGGIETTLIFHDGFDLPLFAAFILLETESGRAALRRYYRHYLAIAEQAGTGFVLESPTWRASWGWAERLRYSVPAVAEINHDAIALMVELRQGFAGTGPVVISGCVGPQGDGYSAEAMLTAAAAEAYHAHQIGVFADTEADMVTAITMTYAGEATGIVRAARAVGLPVAISFTTETDGRLPSGQPLGEAIEEVDAATGSYAAYFMINCAHPTHFGDTLRAGGAWRERIRGVRANASTLSHEELDAAEALDDGDPNAFGQDYLGLKHLLPRLSVLGGCCGTDHRHVGAAAQACTG